MKKALTIIPALALIGFAMVSCKKDHTCECTTGNLTGSTIIKDSTKKDAKKACEDLETSISTCKLK